MEAIKYVHGYSDRESLRLNEQADTLENIIHNDTLFPKGALILEAGCGVGAQTKIMAMKNPDSKFISIDVSEDSVREARRRISALKITNVEFRQGDIYELSFDDETFDSVILCFVLEHLHNPAQALSEFYRVLKKGGSIVTIEGDHGSTFFYPDSPDAHAAIDCQVQLQRQSGGNSNIGRQLYPLLKSAGFSEIMVSPRVVYVDATRPQLVDGFIKNTFTAMILGVREESLKQGITDSTTFDNGIKDLFRTAEPDGVFCYTFFKAFATKE